MRAGIVINAGGAQDQVELAERAEAAGWDGIFTYDAIDIGGAEMFDPWTLLAAMAVRTTRVRLGAVVFAPTRRRPWKVAREAMTIDHLSSGRLVVPVGLGALDDRGFANVGETTAIGERAAMLDETLAILDGLWTGRPFGHQGTHYRFGPMTFLPRPVQQPRIPIWVVAVSTGERSMARAARWDGLVLQTEDPVEIASITARARSLRVEQGRPETFDIVAQGTTPIDAAAARAIAAPVADAGATWWVEADWTSATLDSLRARIDAGPPRVS
jgi:alkanesulfonate monooxygenase SsuD/methylene tetrahydromethanopterin reductase-like flavin-dependent oxidoreductase (luciferase family)